MRGMPESTLLRAQGAINLSSRGGWRLGWLSLGETKLVFQQPGRRGALRVDLDKITRLDVERRTFVVCAKRVIRLTYLASNGVQLRSCWLITAGLGAWETALRLRVAPSGKDLPASALASPMAGELGAALAGLGQTAGLILDYLAHRGHATTAELMAVIGAETEDDLFVQLNEGFRYVRPPAGGPAIRCDPVYFDQRSGVVRQQSWRACESVAGAWLASRAQADVLVEDDELLVVTSVPTRARGTLPSVRVDPGGYGLVVRGTQGHDRWIALPEAVAGEARCAVGATGTLVIRAWRRAKDSGGELAR